jgi:hypothetical protein
VFLGIMNPLGTSDQRDGQGSGHQNLIDYGKKTEFYSVQNEMLSESYK